jgi:allophanate hydrolase subunit 2
MGVILRKAPVGSAVRVRQFGRQKYGVPTGGPFDEISAALCNALMGNEEGAPVFEASYGLVELEADSEGALFSVLGASVVGATEQSGAGLLALEPGETVRLMPCGEYFRFYLALPGGVEKRSETLRAKGGPSLLESTNLVIPQLLSDRASARGFVLDRLTGVVEVDSNRVGVRIKLDQPLRQLPEQLKRSLPVGFGTIQVPAGDSLVVLGPDCGTLGGYPVLGYFDLRSRSKMAHWAPGLRVQIEPSGE